MENHEVIEVLYNGCYGGWTLSEKAKELYNIRKLKNTEKYLSRRSDPVLIQIYYELGDEFDGKYSKTKIEKIPKKYAFFYDINEYDGLETVTIDYTRYKLVTIQNKIKELLQNTNTNDEKINELQLFITEFENIDL